MGEQLEVARRVSAEIEEIVTLAAQHVHAPYKLLVSTCTVIGWVSACCVYASAAVSSGSRSIPSMPAHCVAKSSDPTCTCAAPL